MIKAMKVRNYASSTLEMKDYELPMMEKPMSINDRMEKLYNEFAEYEHCKGCQKVISNSDEQEGKKIYLQTTNCFHPIHKDCLAEIAYK